MICVTGASRFSPHWTVNLKRVSTFQMVAGFQGSAGGHRDATLDKASGDSYTGFFCYSQSRLRFLPNYRIMKEDITIFASAEQDQPLYGFCDCGHLPKRRQADLKR